VIQDAVVEVVDVTELENDVEPEGAVVVGEDADGTVVVKRKTRRGSRGGRNRRKKPVAVEGAETEGGTAVAAVATGVVDSSAGDGAAEDLPELTSRTCPPTCRCPSGSTISTADDAPVSLHSVGLWAPARIFRAREHPRMSYAIISLGGKQYRVSEGQRLLVDRLTTEDGKTFTPDVLLVGGNGAPALAPKDVTVTVKVIGQQRGPKIRIGKYKKRTGYKRHTGFRSALTQIEIESIGGRKKAAPKPKAEAVATPTAEVEVEAKPKAAPGPRAAAKPKQEPDVAPETTAKEEES
jgi:large subunit ribosomal protein L21